MGKGKQKIFLANLDELHAILSWIRKEAEAAHAFNSKELYQIELASEEAIVNIIQHAYQGQGGEIEIVIRVTPEQLEIELIDSGRAFHFTEPSVDLTAPLEERKAGGLGLFFMQKSVDEIRYETKNHRNYLTMIKKIK